MRILRYSDPDFDSRLGELTAGSSLFDREIEDRAGAIVEAVRARGDAAVLELTERFDGVKLAAHQLAVTKPELLRASLEAGVRLRSAIAIAKRNIEAFARKSLRRGWTVRNAQGARVGEKFDPFQRVGIYVPGGKAPLLSTGLMTVLLARVAGCVEVVVCTPCDGQGEINSGLLFALREAGATEIYRIGGAQAIAAMALGTATVRRVQKVFGPGNAYVVAAKRLLFGHAAMDLLPGPSELLILADDSAPAEFVAADLLAQAEHGSGHERVWLVTTSGKLIRGVEREVARQVLARSRRGLIEGVIERNGWLVLVETMGQGIELANRLAPEHCQVMTRRPGDVAAKLTTAGAIFCGAYSPAVLGDYLAGPSHVLPTGGAGASFSGLTVDQFQRRTSVIEYSRRALEKSIGALRIFVEVEGLEAHGQCAEVRLGRQRRGAGAA
jgi:histidinol dehydrogenase